MDGMITIKTRSQLYGLQNIPVDQLVYCSKDNTIFHLKDISRKNKSDGWEQVAAIPRNVTHYISSGDGYLTAETGDLRYVRLYDSSYHVDQTIYGDINVVGNITATGEISAFTAAAPTNWWSSMPYASATTVGGIKVGANLTIDANGVLNASGGAGSAAWGSISGTITDQTDLTTALGLKANLDDPIFTTKIRTPSIYGTATGTRLGIFTTTPDDDVHLNVDRNGGTYLKVSNNAGVGNTSAFAGIIISTRDSAGTLQVYPSDYSVTQFQDRIGLTATSPSSGGLYLRTTANSPIDFYTYGAYLTPTMRLTGGGYLGLGTDTPDEKAHIVGNLHVVGNIYASGEISAFSAADPGTSFWNMMPVATSTTLGGVKIDGGGLSIDGFGFLSITTGGGMVYPSGSGIAIVTSGSSWGTTITNNSANWDIAYADRMKWDGGSTGLVAVTGRSSLGLGTAAVENVGYFAIAAHNHSGVYLPVSEAGDIYTHNASEFSTTSHNHNSAYLIKTGDDTMSGYLTATGFKTTNFTITQDTGRLVIKYGTTIIGSISSAGYLKMLDEVGAFETP